MPVRPSPISEHFLRRRWPFGSGSGEAQAGFTLVEATLALALIGLITALALPRALPNAGPTALRVKALEIAALLRVDRNAALRTGRMVTTAVDAVGRLVRSGASDATIIVPNAFALQLATGIPGVFRFFPDGTSSGGELILARPDSGVSVRVNDLTAAVSVRRADIGPRG